MIRRFCAIAVSAAAFVAAQAQEATPPPAQSAVSQVDVWTVRFNDMVRACEAAAAGAACEAGRLAVQADLAAAMTLISYMDDKAAAREAVRPALAIDAPGVQTAAAYALARLVPEEKDTPLLLGLLNDPVPTLRRAAWGALNASPDPSVRDWVARAKGQLVGERFVDDVRPTDVATLGVALPPGSVPVWLEVPAWRFGAQVFTADGQPGDVITYFSNIAGRGSMPLEDAAAMFADDKGAAQALERYRNAAWYQSPYVVVLDDGVAGDTSKPRRLAVVWYDVQFGKAGFALQWLPSGAMPGSGQTPWSGYTPLPATLGVAAAGEAVADESWVKPDAQPVDTEAFSMARSGDVRAAELYLELFPEGAYRAEAEALKAQPWVKPVDVDPVEPTSVRIAFANLPTDKPVRFDVVSDADIRSWAEQSRPQTAQPSNPVSAPPGQSSGEVVWTADRMMKPGLYQIRVFYGEDKMDFDGLSLAKMLPAEEAQMLVSLRIVPRTVEFTLDKPVYNFGEAVRISYKGMPKANSDNAGSPFFTIVPKGAPDKDWGRYIYTKDQLEGTIILEAPSTPGDYEVRALFQEDAIVRGVQSFTVDPARATAAVPTPTPVPTPAPTPEPEDMNVVITLTKPVFAAGEAITGNVTGLSGDRDWVAVVPAGSEDGATGQWVYTGGATEAAFTLPGQQPGAYEIRVRFHDQYRPVRRRLPIEVK